MLAHQGLRVYDKALEFVGAVSRVSVSWSRKHAVVDELDRASESIVLNLAEGANLYSGGSKLRALEYALGSAFESAACLDISAIKSLLPELEARRTKQSLHEVVCMLIGLRKTWQAWQVHEDPATYDAPQKTHAAGLLFHHEKLEAYRTSLELIGWLTALLKGNEPSSRLHRQLDESFTSIVLNIAEGNGRYFELDHRHFLMLAQTSAVKAGTLVDLAVQKRLLAREEADHAQVLIEQVVSMLGRM
jgi:four helix bundle protein